MFSGLTKIKQRKVYFIDISTDKTLADKRILF